MLIKARIKRQKRVRSKIEGTKDAPRVSVFRSNKYIYAQAIDDQNGKTLASVSESEFKESSKKKVEKAKELGMIMAAKIKKVKVEKIVFDRGSFKYHGRVEAFAQGLREGGIKF